MKNLNTIELSYLAGFIDGDGCILAQIVRRKDYSFGFQIRISLIVYQKSSRLWFLMKLKKN